MENIKNISQATEYVYNQLKEINPEIEKNDIYDSIIDEILTSVQYILTDDDIRYIEKNQNNISIIDEYLQKKIPDYADLLDDIVTDMISEEILEE